LLSTYFFSDANQDGRKCHCTLLAVENGDRKPKGIKKRIIDGFKTPQRHCIILV